MSSVLQQSSPSVPASDEQRMLRDAATSFLGRDTSIARVRKQRWQAMGFDRAAWEKMAELGWLGILVPEQYGGMGLGLGEMRAVAEELAKGLVPEPLNAVAVLARGALQYGENEALKQKLLPQLAQGKLILGLAWQEEQAGLAAGAIHASVSGGKIQVRATQQGQELRLSVADDGKGVSTAEGAHLFDPFYCGRQVGRGLGLGLPRAARSIALAGGSLTWSSAVDQGSTFQVQLPSNPPPNEPTALSG